MTNSKPAPPPVVKRAKPEQTQQVRHYKLITPLFGGGVIPQTADPVSVVRGSAVRGHLRFWWRATRGGEFGGDLAAMKAYEDNLWGSASIASKVSLTVTPHNRGKPFVATDNNGTAVPIGDPSSLYSYVAFPMRDADDKPSDDYCLEGVEFKLGLTYPAHYEADIAAALWAWETFGGVGARTRRGFGALACLSVAADGDEAQKVSHPTAEVWLAQIKQEAKHHISGGQFPADVPHLAADLATLRLTREHNNSDEAWLKGLVEKLKLFRQNRHGNNNIGPSKWPEANAIRQLFGYDPREDEPQIDQFPRADFGLPIIFQFKASKKAHEPEQTSLQGADHDRLASPLILRPLLCAQNRAIGMAVLLQAPRRPPGGLLLKKDDSNSYPVTADLTPDEAKKLPLGGATDVLQAFLKTIG